MKTASTNELDAQPLPRQLELALLIGIVLIAVILRVIALRSLPPGLRYDELVNATGVDQVLREGPVIYFTTGCQEVTPNPIGVTGCSSVPSALMIQS